ncbi:hypothetical protein LNP26_27695 [Klebsiella variicola subsp. variicola]|nr:hypothetical protein [Klebsiella variicola subsp. variicola]
MMSGTTLLIHLAGAIALLLWGSHMISTALQRGFGTPLRNWMGRHLLTAGPPCSPALALPAFCKAARRSV